MNKIYLSDLVKRFGGELVGEDILISDIAPIEMVKSNEITFLVDAKYKKQLENTNASAIIVSVENSENIDIPKIITDNPYWYFSQISQLFHVRKKLPVGISKTAVISDSSTIADSPHISHYVVIGENVTIKNNCQIYSHVIIGDNVTIGENVIIYPNVTIYDNVKIGDNCILHSGVVIGSDGFGNARDNKKEWSDIPQIGGVVIGNNVNIGANTTIDCGTFTPTIIEDGVVIDNLVQIAHNVKIGAHTGIAACVGIAGSTTIGKYCQLGGGCAITGHITIADNTVIGGHTGVTKSITKPDLYFSVYPFSTLKEWAKNAVHVRNLDSIYKRLKTLENMVKPKTNS